jgi:hypothetical protein
MAREREGGREIESYLRFLFFEQNSTLRLPGGLLRQTSVRSGGLRWPHRRADRRNSELGLGLLWQRGGGLGGGSGGEV